METFRKKMAHGRIFAAFFFAVFAILVSFHHHETGANDVSGHHCTVCQSSSSPKATAGHAIAFSAPQLSFEYLHSSETTQGFLETPSSSDPIRGPPLA